MDAYMVVCKDRKGLQHSTTFDFVKSQDVSVIRRAWKEATRLCGHINAVAHASVSTLDGRVVGTLR